MTQDSSCGGDRDGRRHPRNVGISRTCCDRASGSGCIRIGNGCGCSCSARRTLLTGNSSCALLPRRSRNTLLSLLPSNSGRSGCALLTCWPNLASWPSNPLLTLLASRSCGTGRSLLAGRTLLTRRTCRSLLSLLTRCAGRSGDALLTRGTDLTGLADLPGRSSHTLLT